MLKSLVGRFVGRSLRTRVLLLVLTAFVAVGLSGWFAFFHVVNYLTLRFGTMIAERQVQYDRFRGMAEMNREMALAESFSNAPAIQRWLRDEFNPDLMAAGLAEMEHYRAAFDDGSAFVVVNSSGNYYFNDSQQSYAANPLSYTLDPTLERDSWYYASRDRREGCYPNVNVDAVLNVTKVWINCLVNDGAEVLGIIGTGIDLSAFIQDVVDIDQAGIESIFVDQSGAVQAHADASLVDFRSITKDVAQKQTVFQLLDTPQDMVTLRRLMGAALNEPESVSTATLSIGGAPQLVGVGYLDHIGWYNVTVMDLGTIINRRLFWPIAAAAIGVLVAIALVLSWIFRVVVLKRLEKVEAGLVAVQEGRRATMIPDPSNDEIGRLSRTLIGMSDAITAARLDLESQVHQRTEQLQSLVNLDDLTKILNRRGFEVRFNEQRRRIADLSQTCGLMLIDVDNFKSVNDSAGHAAGDRVVIEVARRLALALRRIDICARWGGDEFIVLIGDCDAPALRQVAGALRDMMRQKPIQIGGGETLPITISIGAVVVAPDDPLVMATDMADVALYSAKEAGRDRVVVFDRDTIVPDESAAAPEVRAS